jgi:uncharacterized cupin superfamily protein
MDAEWQRLGDAAGTIRVGVNRARIAPGKLSTPPHSHGASEEIVYVLGGTGLVWQDEAVFEVAGGDCVVFRADEAEHTLRGGDDGLDVLIYGTRHPVEYGWLPRSRAMRMGWPWVEGRTDNPWELEAQAEPLAFGPPGERPANVVAADGVPPDRRRVRALADAAGSVQTGLNLVRLDPGGEGSQLHSHGAEEEVFVLLEGEATLVLDRARLARSDAPQSGEHHVRAGNVISRPAGSRVAHQLRAGANGVTYLAYGTREPNDIVYYPRTGEVFLRGAGVTVKGE